MHGGLGICAAFLAAALVCTSNVYAWQGKEATDATREANRRSAEGLPFHDKSDFDDAMRGFIAPLPNDGRIASVHGGDAWNLAPYAFLSGADNGAPDTVNPSLWRQSRLVMINGLFKVCDGIYQVRNADISNLTIIEGNTGIIIADPLVSAENARAALNLYFEHRPKKPVRAVIYSHSHVDHYGGVLGVTTLEDVRAGRVAILAPDGFLEAAVSENVMAGCAMSRRASFMYGTALPPSPRGHVGSGLGLKNSTGTRGLIPPTDIIRKSGEERTIDGVTFIFLMAKNTEAPAEMHWYIPKFRALTAAENCVHTMHNLYTLRGAKTRDPLCWARALEETLERFGDKADVLYGMHHWPVWGGERVRALLGKTADLYRFIHDQTLHLANLGYSMQEIAEEITLPDELAKTFALRGYYGSLNHNSKAVYNFYLGWFDGNPAHLHALPPVAAAKKYVEYMGGANAVLARARGDFKKGEYRFVAEVLSHVVFADPSNQEARNLEADALEQMGYQAESGPWRNFYLSGARELREGSPKALPRDADQQAKTLPLDLYFANLAVRLDGKKASGKTVSLIITVADTKKQYRLDLRNAVLHARECKSDEQAALHVTAPKEKVLDLFEGRYTPENAKKDNVFVGDSEELARFLSLFTTFSPAFALIEP
ncbi:MAG: MBL fold metallo-hydrolase [Desulfovibrionaceae bacterium]|nr:MBL fold metallo-hydrolase [Desulfovibrionaceae bacterium]